MPYNYEESATVNTNVSNLVIANEAYVNNPDYKLLTVTSNGGVAAKAENLSILSGGTVTLAGSATLKDATISAGGSLYFTAGIAQNLTVLSGGSVSGAAWGQTWRGLTTESGAVVKIVACTMSGRSNNIKKGTLAGNMTIASDTIDGVMYGVRQTAGAINYYDIVMSNYVNNGTAYTYMYSGCSIINGSAINAGGGFSFRGNGGYLENVQVTNGKIWTNTAGVTVSLGGANTNITQGHWYHCAAAGTTNQDTALYASGGVLYGVTIKTNGNWLRNLTVVSGLTISAPVVSSGGTLYIGNGGTGTEILVHSTGKFYVTNGGRASGVTVNGDAVEGVMNIMAGGYASGVTVSGTNSGSSILPVTTSITPSIASGVLLNTGR